jgi:hypothetical protein
MANRRPEYDGIILNIEMKVAYWREMGMMKSM